MIIQDTELLPVRCVASTSLYLLVRFNLENIYSRVKCDLVSFLGCWDVLHQSPRASECFFIFNGMVDQAYI